MRTQQGATGKVRCECDRWHYGEVEGGGAGSGGPLPITECPLCLATPLSWLSDGELWEVELWTSAFSDRTQTWGQSIAPSLSLPSSQDNPDTFWHKPKESVHKCAWAQLEIQAGGSPVTGITPGSALPSHHSAADSRERRKYKERDRESHLDTISLSQGKHLRHSSRHAGLQGSKVIMTNEWPRSPERPREVPLESLSRGTEDTETHSPGQEKKRIVAGPGCKTQPAAPQHEEETPSERCRLTFFTISAHAKYLHLPGLTSFC